MSKNMILLAAVLALFCADAFAQAKQPWQIFKTAKGKFSVNMPCKPDTETRKDATDATEQVFHSCNTDSGRFVVTYADFEIVLESKAMLDAYTEGTVSNATLVSQKNILMGRIPGRELVVSSCEEGGALIYKWHIYHTGRRIYAITVATDKPVPAATDITKFLASFAIQP